MIPMPDTLLLAAINWHSCFFYLFAAIACAFGVAVLFTSNVVRMAFYLVISLAATAALFFLAGAEFLGAMQIMIYVGGTLVLLIFGVMLTAQEAFINMKTRGGEWILGLIVGASFLILLINTAVSVRSWQSPHPEMVRYSEEVRRAEEIERNPRSTDEEIENAWASVREPEFRPQQPATAQMGFALTGARVDEPTTTSPTLRRGRSGYLLAFQAVGFHLLVVLVGAAYLSRTKRFVGGRSRAAAAFEARPRGRRSTLVGALITLEILYNGLAAVAMLSAETLVARFRLELVGLVPQWTWMTIGLLYIANILLLAVIWGWQRWGLVALWLVPLVQAGVGLAGGLDVGSMVAHVVVMYVPAGVLTAAVCAGRPSMWSQMD